MSEAANGSAMKTFPVRLSEELRAQLDVIGQLTGRSATEEIRLAIEHWIDKVKSDPEVLKKADAVRADIERDAQTRRNAIDAIFSGAPPAKPRSSATKPAPNKAETP